MRSEASIAVPAPPPPPPSSDPLAPLAREARALAPGMRELGRGMATQHEAVDLASGELCVRVVFDGAVRAELLDDRGVVLGTSTTGVLLPRGPVCVGRGRRIKLRFSGPTHWIAWGAP
ncbi:MAG: hypothetical protein WCI05_14970 [Myxococcales bacterium]